MKKNKTNTLDSLYRISKVGSWAVLIAILGSVLSGIVKYGLTLILGLFSKEAIYQANMMTFQPDRFKTLLIILVLFIPAMIGGQVLNLYGAMRVDRNIKASLFQVILKRDESLRKETHTGKLMSILTSDAFIVDDFFFQGSNFRIIQPFITGLLALVTLLVIDYRFALVTSIFGFVSIFMATLFTTQIQKNYRDTRFKNDDSVHRASEIIENETMIRQYGIKNKIIANYDESNLKYSKSIIHANTLQLRIDMLQTLINIISLGLFLIIAYQLSTNGNFDFTNIVVLMPLRTSVSQMFSNLGSSWNYMVEVSTSSDRLLEILSMKVEDDRMDKEPLILNKGDFIIQMEDVSFGYDKKNILNNVSLNFSSSQSYALVGHSGSGKSTLLNLLLGLYNTYTGRISINGHDVNELSLSSIRKEVVLVEQEASLFNRSIYDNIVMGSDGDLSEIKARVITAAKKSGIHDYIMSLDNTYDTIVGESGSLLSGGQIQRIAIARALMTDASIVIFDEPTAALDSESEQVIQNVIDLLSKEKLVLVSAHRLSTIQVMDEIIVLDEGMVMEKGNHATLKNKHGIYANLLNYQKEISYE